MSYHLLAIGIVLSFFIFADAANAAMSTVRSADGSVYPINCAVGVIVTVDMPASAPYAPIVPVKESAICTSPEIDVYAVEIVAVGARLTVSAPISAPYPNMAPVGDSVTLKAPDSVPVAVMAAVGASEIETAPANTGSDAGKILEDFETFAAEDVLPGLRKKAQEAEIETIEIAKAPALIADQGDDAEVLIKLLAKANATGAVSYATEAGHFQEMAEIPTFVCGPGDIAQAHKPDEFIALSQIGACEQFLKRLLDVVSDR